VTFEDFWGAFLNRLLGAIVATSLMGGCAYQAEPVAAPARNVITSFAAKVPGKWLLYVDAERLNELVRPSDLNCAAHTFPLDFRSGFPASVRETLPNVFERIETVDSPVGAERLRAMGARGIIIVRGESLNSRLRVVPGFWSNNISTDVDLAVGVQVEGPSGRLFGKTVADGAIRLRARSVQVARSLSHRQASRPRGRRCVGLRRKSAIPTAFVPHAEQPCLAASRPRR
jgi:hypothetical protein